MTLNNTHCELSIHDKYKQSSIAYEGLVEQKTCKRGKHLVRKLRTEEISPPSGKTIRVINRIFVPRNITF